MSKQKHLMLPAPVECSMHPEYKCRECGTKLFTERKMVPHAITILRDENGKRHYKSRCNFKQGKAEGERR